MSNNNSIRRSLRWFTYPLSILYGGASAVLKVLHTLKGVNTFNRPVICIGNLSSGGTGKTPMSLYLMQFLAEKKLTVISRGYRRKSKGIKIVEVESKSSEVGDEALMCKKLFPGINFIVSEDRSKAIEKYTDKESIILLDDAFQHWPLKASFYLLLSNYEAPFYEDQCIPLGNLREFPKACDRADLIIITKCPSDLNSLQKAKICQKIKAYTDKPVLFSKLIYRDLYTLSSNKKIEIEQILSKEILLLTGIADNKPILTYLNELNITFKSQLLEDHAKYDTERIINICNSHKNHAIITTEKDAVKLIEHLSVFKQFGVEVFVLPVCIEFLDQDAIKLKRYLLEHLASFDQ